MLDSLAGLTLGDACKVLDHSALHQIQKPRQAQAVRELQQIQAFIRRDGRDLVEIQIAQELVESVFGDVREHYLQRWRVN